MFSPQTTASLASQSARLGILTSWCPSRAVPSTVLSVPCVLGKCFTKWLVVILAYALGT